MKPIIFVLFVGFAGTGIVQGQLYGLEFRENGQIYKELITVDKQDDVLIYDVPKHAQRGAVTYLKDFKHMLNVMRDNEKDKCFVWGLSKEEPTLDSVVQGLKEVKNIFPNQTYSVNNDNMLQIGKYDLAKLPKNIKSFCHNKQIIEVVIFADVTKMQKHVRKIIKNKFAPGKKNKRALDVYQYVSCTNSQLFRYEVLRCYKAGRPDLLQLRCKILLNSHSTYTVSCKKKTNTSIFTCPHPFHTMSQIRCCSIKCLA